MRQLSKMLRARRIVGLGLLFTTLLATATPLLACTFPRSAADQHGCCPKSQATLQQSKLPTTTTCCDASRAPMPTLLTDEPGSSLHAIIAPLPATDVVRPVSRSVSLMVGSSPPDVSPGCSAILRV